MSDCLCAVFILDWQGLFRVEMGKLYDSVVGNSVIGAMSLGNGQFVVLLVLYIRNYA